MRHIRTICQDKPIRLIDDALMLYSRRCADLSLQLQTYLFGLIVDDRFYLSPKIFPRISSSFTSCHCLHHEGQYPWVAIWRGVYLLGRQCGWIRHRLSEVMGQKEGAFCSSQPVSPILHLV